MGFISKKGNKRFVVVVVGESDVVNTCTLNNTAPFANDFHQPFIVDNLQS
jgi:hypothetical protein